jgi:hypothetical protein
MFSRIQKTPAVRYLHRWQRLQGKRRANNRMEADRGGDSAPERDSGSKNDRKSRIWFWLSPPAAHAER